MPPEADSKTEPAPETQTSSGTAAPAAPEPEAVEGGGGSASPPASGEAGPGPSGEAKTPQATAPASAPEPWYEKRIGKLTAEKADLLRRLQAFETKPQDGGPVPPVAPAPAPAQAEIEAAAQRLVAQQQFASSINEVVNAGKLAYPDFETKVRELPRLVDSADANSMAQYYGMIEAAMATGQAPGLLYRLAGDLNEAARVLALPPAKMGVELAKLASAPPPAVSGAPRPITPVGGKGSSHDRIDPTDPERADGLSTRDWMERRERQVSDRNGTVH